MKKTKLRVLHIYPGPIYDAQAVHQRKYEGFSNFCSGAVVSTTNIDQDYQFGDFNICLRRPEPRNGLTLFLSLLKNSIVMAKKIDDIDLVVSYDPLKTGIIGLIIKILFSCKLLVEVNGVYSDENLYSSHSRLTKLKRSLYKRIQNFVLARADGVKGLFEGQLDNLSISKSSAKATFFDYTDIEPNPPVAVQNKNILSIGFPVHIKGIDILVDAFKDVRADDWTLTILGHFIQSDMAILKKLVGDNPNINVLPPVHFSKIPSFIDESDILVLASRSEGMGRVLIEAAARGKARIGSRVGGIPTVIDDRNDGYLVESENVEELTAVLSMLIHDDKERTRISRASYDRFLADFSLDVYLERYNDLYKATVDKKPTL